MPVSQQDDTSPCILVLNPERRIKGRDDAALCAGLAVQLDRFVTDALIDEALRLKTRRGGMTGKPKKERNKQQWHAH